MEHIHKAQAEKIRTETIQEQMEARRSRTRHCGRGGLSVSPRKAGSHRDRARGEVKE